MKLKKMNWGQAIAMGTVSVGFVQALSAATVITNDATGAAGNNVNVAVDFASNISVSTGDFTVTGGGTPGVALSWGSGWQNYDWNGNGGSIQVDTVNLQTIDFTPNVGLSVVITSADFDFWTAKDGWNIDWSVTGNQGTNVNGTWTSSAGVRRETVDFNVQGLAGEVLTLGIQQVHGNYGGSFAVDNITFDQVTVPEPSSTALLGLGLGAAAMRRRRK